MIRVRAISWRNVQAQSMVEVAIFGGVIIFLIGALVKNVVTTSFAQQYALRTMREALTKAQAGVPARDPISGDSISVQKPYNLIIIEDRLFPGVTKFGSTERTPYITSTSAVFTNDLFGAPYDLNNAPGSFGSTDIPVLHMRMNGMKKDFTLGAWRPFSGGCVVAKRNPPGSDSSWKPEALSNDDFKKIMVERGRVLCYLGGFPALVFQKEPPDDPPQYYAIDPRAGEMNPYDPSQGLQQTSSIETQSKGTLVVPASGKGSSSTNKQTDRVYRNVLGNNGAVFWFNTPISYTRSH